jgi:hypothetical protein
MTLHARSVAVAAGAAPGEVDEVAAIMVRARTITPEAAARAIDRVRAGTAGLR